MKKLFLILLTITLFVTISPATNIVQADIAPPPLVSVGGGGPLDDQTTQNLSMELGFVNWDGFRGGFYLYLFPPARENIKQIKTFSDK